MALSQKKDRILNALADFSLVVLISIAFLIVYLNVNPFDRGFYCSDESIRFPYKKDTVPLVVAGLYGAIAGITFVIIAEIALIRPCCGTDEISESRSSRCLLNCIYGVLLYSLGAMSTMLITEVGKHTIGRLRPHFIDVCKPDWSKIKCYETIEGEQVANYVHYTPEICTGDAHLIKEARLSFPSGHSSFTAFSMVFVIIYLEARLIQPRTRFLKHIIQLIAFIATWHTCMSRVSDFKHHWTDVLAGALVGISVAIFMTIVTGKRIWNHIHATESRNSRECEEGQALELL